MINRRTFIFRTSSTPLLLLFNGGVVNLAAASTHQPPIPESSFTENSQSPDFAIHGWHETDCDSIPTRLVKLSASWKSSWL